MPAGPTRLSNLLPFLRYLTDRFVDFSVENVQAEGLAVSCKRLRCCLLSATGSHFGDQARRLGEVVDQMPEPRKSTILARFEEARRRLQAAGLLERLREPNRIGDDEGRSDRTGLFSAGNRLPVPGR